MNLGLWARGRRNLKYHPGEVLTLTLDRHPARGPCQAGSLTGAVAS
jgi:hypothetical protein